MPVGDRFGLWVAYAEQSLRRLALAWGCDASHLSHLKAGRKRPSLRLACTIEKATADWPEGPIRASEWLEDEEKAA